MTSSGTADRVLLGFAALLAAILLAPAATEASVVNGFTITGVAGESNVITVDAEPNSAQGAATVVFTDAAGITVAGPPPNALTACTQDSPTQVTCRRSDLPPSVVGPSGITITADLGDQDDSLVLRARELSNAVIAGGPGGDVLDASQSVIGVIEVNLDGGPGADRVLGSGGYDSLKGGTGRDRVSGGALEDEIRGGPGRDRLRGNASDDTLYGAGGGDRLLGGTGSDALRGGPAFDELIGGPGSDHAPFTTPAERERAKSVHF